MRRQLSFTMSTASRLLGIDATALRKSLMIRERVPADLEPLNAAIFKSVEKYTMTSPERVSALVDAVRYVVSNQIEGALVECGVWRGGSAMAMALVLLQLGHQTRDIYLYDTFAGMPAPSACDVSAAGEPALARFPSARKSDDSSSWCCSPLDEVKKNVYSTGYPQERFRFVEGKVEDTIPGTVPERIALLRLDTDWYESTKHELVHLYPLLCSKGVIVIDDYGHWQGARQAVDEYLSDNEICILLNRIDSTGRIGVKA